MKTDKDFMEMLKAKFGFTTEETENIKNNVQHIASLLTLTDFVLREIDVRGLRGLNEIVTRAKAKLAESNDPALKELAKDAAIHDGDKSERLEMICDFAEKYQARFGKEKGFGDEPSFKINAFPQKPVVA